MIIFIISLTALSKKTFLKKMNSQEVKERETKSVDGGNHNFDNPN